MKREDNKRSVKRRSSLPGYNYGSAAQKLEPERELRKRAAGDKRRRKTAENRTPAPAPKRSAGKLFGSILAATVLVGFFGFLGSVYLKSEKRVSQAERARNEAQSKLEAQREVNDTLQVEINRKEDLDHIRDLAVNRYGMVQPGQDQIRYYKRVEQGYVRQYENIPKKSD
ncbi:hypothetical protein [Stomatobaculum sp.]